MATIQGDVEDEAGNSIEGATVTIRDSATQTIEAETTTAADGTFSVTVDPDTYDIRIERIGYQVHEQLEVTVGTGETYSTLVALDPLPTKVIGRRSDGIGVHGETTAGSGTPIALKGEVAAADGFGVFTPDDARVDGVTKLETLGGGLTGGTEISTLAGEHLSVENGALTAFGPIVQPTRPPVAAAGTDWKRLAARGTEIWNHTHHGHYVNAVFERDGVVYSGSNANDVVAADATDGGSLIWSHALHSETVNDVFERNGTVYSGSYDNKVIAASAADGSLLWEHSLHSSSPTVPRVWAVYERNGVVYSGGADAAVIAADAAGGSQLWSHTHHSDEVRDVFERTGVVYSASADGTVIAADVDSNGGVLWDHTHHSGNVYGVFERNGLIYSGSLDGTVVAADADDGTLIWQQGYGAQSVLEVFERNGVVYLGTLDGPLVAADASDGAEIWRHTLHGSNNVQSVFERDGVVYSASTDNTVRAAVSDPATYVSDGSAWLFESRLVSDREGGQLG